MNRAQIREMLLDLVGTALLLSLLAFILQQVSASNNPYLAAVNLMEHVYKLSMCEFRLNSSWIFEGK